MKMENPYLSNELDDKIKRISLLTGVDEESVRAVLACSFDLYLEEIERVLG